MNIVALIPAYNEDATIANTVAALLANWRRPDHIIVIPNGCTDSTAEAARTFERQGVTVLELPRLEHKKSQALNIGWARYTRDADVVICLDADTVLPPNAVGDWEAEFEGDAALGGSSSKFTMAGNAVLTCLQRAEFAKWTDTALIRGWTSVLAGTGCAISGEALRLVVDETGQDGPWSYDSQVEDFLLTYEIRRRGYRCQVSPTVRAYTDAMDTVRALWAQRLKWQVGTVEDLLSIGVNRLTLVDWGQQAAGLALAFARVLLALVIVGQALAGRLSFQWYWWVALPLVFAAAEMWLARRIPHCSRRDMLVAATILPNEAFAWLRAAWFIRAWIEVLAGKITGRRKDHWRAQYVAEGIV